MSRSTSTPKSLAVESRADRHFAFTVIVVFTTWSCLCLPTHNKLSLFAAETETAPIATDSSIVYRRVYVPADNVEAWPRNGDKYVPVESREFNAWVNAANQAASNRASAATIDTAEYTARLEDDGRVQGRGKWNISVRDDKSAFLSLEQTSLVVRNAHWHNAAQQPVRLGVWSSAAGEPDRLGLEVPHSGLLEFEWSVPAPSQHDEIDIPWRLPIATSTRLILDLPDGKQPRIDGGVVLESKPLTPNGTTNDEPRTRWILAVNPASGTALRITNPGHDSANTTDQLTLRAETSYRIEQRGLEISATWRLEGAINQQRELSVPLPRGAQLASVVAEGRELDWRVVRGASPVINTAIIDIPNAANLRSLQVILSAWQPLLLDLPWRLPTLQPDDVFWSSGNLQLSIASEFELLSLKPLDCAQSGVGQVGADATSPETYSLLSYAPTATLEVAIARRQPDATIRVGSSLALADPDVTGRLATEWSVARSSLHRLSGELARGWNVETVETIPADALAEWFIDRRGNHRHLEIQLTDAASPARNVSVIIMGRLQRFTLAEPISTDTLRMVNWAGARVLRHLLTFQSTEPFAVDLVGEMPLLARESVNSNDLALLDAATDDSQFVDLTRAGKDAGLQLTFKRGQYAAEVDLDASYAKDELRHVYRVTARPKANSVDRLLIYATAPLGDNVRWTDKSTDSPISAERLPADDPQRKSVPKEGELWLLRLPQPMAGTIEVCASVTTPWQKRAAVPLLALPEAIEQHGHATIRGGIGSTPAVEPTGLAPIPLPADERDMATVEDRLPVRAAFRFNPTDCLDSSRSPRLWIGPAVQSGTSALTVRHLELESFFWPDGRGSHQATYQLENIGAADFEPPLPLGARLSAISVNGKSSELSTLGDGGQPPRIHLPPQMRSATVAICFETQGALLTAGGALDPPLVQNGIPVLSGEWTVWLPDEYSTNIANSPVETAFNWRQRLFGPFGRPSSASPFHPFRPADWAHLVNGVADWNSPSSTESAPTNPLPGWRAYQESFVADGAPDPIVVLHAPAITAWSVALLLASLLVGRWLCRGRGTLLVSLLAIAASLALLLPAAFAPLATGVMWGLLCSLLVEWPLASLTADAAPNRRRLRMAVVGVATALIAIGLTGFSLAQPPEAQNSTPTTPASTPIERVLIPIDSDNRPSGTKYYLGEQFLRKLLTSTSNTGQVDGQWLLRDAAYAGELTENRGSTDTAAGNWSLAFSIETLARETTIVLPLVRDEANWQPTAMLDGVPVPLTWRDDGRKCAIEIAEPGQYVLTVYCVPKMETTDGRSQFNLTIPPLLSATIQLHVPELLTGIKVVNASLSPAAKDAPGVLNGNLVHADHLTVRWPSLEMKSSASQRLSVTELSWLHIAASETELETKYVIEGGARRPDVLTIMYDDRWKPLTKANPPADKPSHGESARQRTLQIPLPAEDIDRQEVSVRWKLTDAPPAGNFRLPPIELMAVPITQRWFALSSDPDLDCTVANNTASDATAKEFLAKWGSAGGSAPQIVSANFDSSRAWTIAVRPRETESVVHEVLHVAAGSQAMRVVYQVNVTPGKLNKFQFPLVVPANLSVDDIVVIEADRQIPTHWARDADNRLNVFFDEEATTDYRLSLSGSMPFDLKKQATLPRVATASPVSATQQVQLYRDDDVHVELQGFPAADESKTGPIDLPPVQWAVRPVGVYHLDEAAASAARVVVNDSHPKTAGDTLSQLTRESRTWWLTFHCHLVVEKGDLDVLRLRIPPTWTGPFEVVSSVPTSTQMSPLDEHNLNLAVRFATTIAEGNEVDLQIRSPLAIPTGSPISVPEIEIKSRTDGHRYLIVPNSLDSQPVAWTEVGVRVAAVPPKLLPASIDLAKQVQLEIINAPFHVEVRSQTAPQPAPRIRLADTTVAAGERGGQLIVTQMVVSSDGLTECTLQLPSNQKLLSVTIDGRPALTSAVNASSWQVALGAAQLPQSLEIVSRLARNKPNDGQLELRRPTLLAGNRPIPVEVSLWSFARPLPATDRRIDGAASVSAIDQAALRFDRLVSIAEAATTAAADAPPPDGENWFRPWAALLRNVQDQTRQIMTQPASEPAVAQVSRYSEEQVARASKRLDEWLQQCGELIASSDAAPPSPPSPTTEHLFTASPTGDGQDLTCYVAEGGADRLVLNLVPTIATPRQIQVLGLLMIVGLSAASAWLIRSPVAADFLCRWPHVVGILLGIAYWAWLRPSWVGLLIAAVSLWLALRSNWPARTLRPEASTVLRSTRSHKHS